MFEPMSDVRSATGGQVEAPARKARRGVVLVTMCVGLFLVQLDVTVVNVALPHIGQELHTGVSGLQWVVDGYALLLASLLLTGGILGDLYGHKRVVLTGLAVFGVASAGAGLAGGVEVLVAFRALQGAGAAVLLPGTLAVITHMFPERSEKARAIGVWAAVSGLALPAGPLLGGILVDSLGWPSIFLINVPIVLIATVVVIRVVRDGNEPTDRRLDLPGVLLTVMLLAAITFVFIEEPRLGWDSIVVLTAIVAAVVLVAAFIWTEHRQAQPMLPLRLFRSRIFSGANAVAGAMNMVAIGMVFVLTLYLQSIQHRSALAAGTALVPMFLLLIGLAPMSGRLTGRIGSRGPMAAGLALGATGMAWLTQLRADSPYASLLPALALIGAGLGVMTPAIVSAAMNAVPAERAGLASGVNNTARQAGGAIGVAAFGSLAGQTARADAFMSGLHTAALIGTAIWIGGIIASFAIGRPRVLADEGHSGGPSGKTWTHDHS
jgi:MFS transporter, DHA2 family, methylenomycin A resistance protein